MSIGFKVLVSRHPAIQTTGLLTLAPAGLSPAEHASLRWTHNRTGGFPAYGSPVGRYCIEAVARRPGQVNAVRSSRIALPARLPSNGFMLSRPPAALPEGSCRLGIMRALTPARLAHAAQVSPLSCLAFRTSHPQPRYGPERRFRSRLNALDGSCDPGFAMDEQARRAMPPNGFVILQAVRSPPTAPHPVSRRRSCLRLHVSRLHIGWTFTSLTRQHHGRTHPRERGDPEFWRRQVSRIAAREVSAAVLRPTAPGCPLARA